MRRLTRGRAATDDEGTPQASAASEPVSAAPHDAQQGGASLPANGSAPTDGETTAVLPAGATTSGDGATGAVGTTDATTVQPATDEERPGRDLPAGVDPDELASVPSSARRSRLRKRLRYLRAVREVLLRDIGGFYFEAQRSEGGVDAHRRLLDAKARRLDTLDTELRELESRLEDPRPDTVLLRQPGLGGTCPECGDIHGSDARFCSRCGTALRVKAKRPQPAAAAAPTTASEEPKATTASLWGRPKRLAVADDPTMATGGNPVAAKGNESSGAAAQGSEAAGAATSEPESSPVDPPAEPKEPTGSERS